MDATKAVYSLYAIFFFLYGGSVHLLFFRFYVNWAYPATTQRPAIDSWLTEGLITVLGGIFVATLMLRLLRQCLRKGSCPPSQTVFKAALYAIFASLLALEAFYLALAIWLSVRLSGGPYAGTFPERLFLSLLEIQTYGMEPVVLALPFGILYGGLAGIVLVSLPRHSTLNSRD